MEISSRITLPISKREKASPKELLKALEEAEAQLEIVVRSPYYDTYMTLSNQVNDWNEQLKLKPGELQKRVIGNDKDGNLIQVDWMPGKIDLFGSKDDKEFERVFKYFLEIIPLLDALDKLRQKLTPQELKQIESTSEIDDVRSSLKNRK